MLCVICSNNFSIKRHKSDSFSAKITLKPTVIRHFPPSRVLELVALLQLSFLKGFGLIKNLNSFLFQHENGDLSALHLRQLHLASYKPRSSVTAFTLNSMGGEALVWLVEKMCFSFLNHAEQNARSLRPIDRAVFGERSR